MLIGATILACSLLCWALRHQQSFLSLKDFFQLQKTRQHRTQRARLASLATLLVSANCFSPSGDTSRKNRWAFGGTQLLTCVIDTADSLEQCIPHSWF